VEAVARGVQLSLVSQAVDLVTKLAHCQINEWGRRLWSSVSPFPCLVGGVWDHGKARPVDLVACHVTGPQADQPDVHHVPAWGSPPRRS
jgi:hypothetical protein